MNLQSKSINFKLWSLFEQNTKAIALLFGQNMAHFHHFSICNQNQSISNVVMFEQNTKAIALLFGQDWLIGHHFSICNQNQSISNLVSFQQNTKAIALLFGHKWLNYHFSNVQSKSINFKVESCLSKIPRL